jgi:uncharacterized membrane protein YccC
MNPSATNYSWSNTSQWSQVPTNANDQQPDTQNRQNNTVNMQNTYPTTNESRKDTVSRLYNSILGREADQAGLNYYLFNTHITELQIAQEMYESTEHTNILARAKDIREMIRKTDEATKRMANMDYTLQSLQTLNENYKNLIDQKTQIINEFRGKLGMSNESEPQDVHYSHTEPNNTQVQNLNDDFLLKDPFANDKPGFFNWVKSWFKFN